MDFFSFLLKNAEEVGIVVIAIVFIAGVVTEHIHVGPEFKRQAKRAEALEAAIQDLTEEVRKSEVAHAEAKVRIEFLAAEGIRREGEMSELRRRIDALQAELDRIRQTWIPPHVSYRQGGQT